MDSLALIAITVVIGFCIYKSGKKTGSRKGYAAGRARGRRYRRRRR